MIWGLVGVAALLAVWAAGSAFAVMGLETARYTVTETRDGYEIRQYPALLVASTESRSTGRGADSENFRKLAGYIFGGNERSEKIAMTVPVFIETAPSGQEMQFVLPSALNKDAAPRPERAGVSVEVQPPRKMAAIRFSWYGTPDRQQAFADKLTWLLKRDGIATAGRPIFAAYNPPMTFPPMRRNEMLIPIGE